jgi:hypothetical protein
MRSRQEIERKAEQRNKERVPLTAQLVVGKDDDLIDWLRSLPEGGRQRAICAILRAGLGLASTEFDTKPMPAVEVAAIDQAAQQRIRELETEIGTLQRWVTYFDEQLRQMNSYGDVTQVAMPVEATEQVDPQRLAKRAQQIKSSKW